MMCQRGIWSRPGRFSCTFFCFVFCFQEIRNQSHECSFKVAKYPENRNRNRYRDVSPCRHTQTERFAVCVVFATGHLMLNFWSVSLLCFPAVDHSRVKLENTDNDYINASLVVVEEAQRRYILTQASIPKITTLYLLQSMTPACEIDFFFSSNIHFKLCCWNKLIISLILYYILYYC